MDWNNIVYSAPIVVFFIVLLVRMGRTDKKREARYDAQREESREDYRERTRAILDVARAIDEAQIGHDLERGLDSLGQQVENGLTSIAHNLRS